MKEKLTPMMAQYLETKEEYKDCILFYRLGDFYEMFFEDAKTVSRELQLTLTGKSCGLEERAPMCGVPYHAADTYIARLIEKGYKVAICEQMEDPALAKGLVKREVVRIVTPGTVVNDSMLDTNSNNYLASVFAEEERTGLVYCDVSTGELVVSDYYGENRNDDVINELIKIDASEIIMNEALRGGDTAGTLKDLTNAYISFLGDSYFDEEAAEKAICRQFSVKAMEGLGIDSEGAYTRALGALLSYLMETQMQAMTQITRVSILDKAGHMTLDRSAVRNLELMETLFEKKVNGSLLGILDHTETAMGSRKLKKWIREPLNKKEGINERLDAVEVLTDDLILRNNLRDALKTVYDLERLTGRVACDKANARDLIALKNSVVNLPDVKSDINAAGSALLSKIAARISNLEDVYRNIDAAILDEPPVTIKEGGLIKDGYSAELDEIKNASSGSLNWIMGLEASEREKTGIKKLKVGYNKVFGYYIEVTKANQDLVPENYIRKQTLVNSERYVTPELKEMESIVLNAESRINSLEYELFCELREELKKHIVDLQETADAISELDVLLSFAEVGSTNGYVRPIVNDSDVLKIVGGRHPVIEQTISNGVFVSNDTYLDRDRQSLLLITGPNMSGKSTYMRQTALIVLMAQMGCFVPAESVEIGTVDRIYTRIGASDNLTQGQSTFFVEMSELANILNTATERSLVILDEIGRGTSTYDGLSIAWAVVDHLCNNHCHIRTLFASHYHELTLLEKKIKGFKNLNVSVSESDGNVVFLYKIAEGSASKSYGIHVAKIAGVPESVLLRASEKLQELESGSVNVVSDTGSGSAFTEQQTLDRDEGEDQMSFLTFKQHPAVDMIRNLDLMNITPSQAIAVLEELKTAVSEL
ncbi:MAG: DNA mismatch repair protein MutS [Clostridia bacterium]|nr:DNA mismatch repair protein MutS [Clostridia bacterium]